MNHAFECMQVFESTRRQYRQKIDINKESGLCPFCHLHNIEQQVCLTFDHPLWMVVANRHPYLDGNLMIIPKRHVEDLDGLTPEEKSSWFEVVEWVKNKFQTVFQATSYNLGLNIGENSGQSIRHLHWQIVPRQFKYNDGAMDLFADLHVITLSPYDLVKMIDGREE